MTREEAKDYIREWCPYDRQEKIIKALEQEPKPMVEIDLYSVIKQKYIEREVLDKIRAEIEDWQTDVRDNEAEIYDFIFERIYEIFDEYKAESEET